jgi:hypothetical protein
MVPEFERGKMVRRHWIFEDCEPGKEYPLTDRSGEQVGSIIVGRTEVVSGDEMMQAIRNSCGGD